jgi:hypothetical protein
MLAPYEFNVMPFSDQAGYVYEKGDFLACRFNGGNNINLYRVGNFFVEVWFNKKVKQIARIRSFTSKAYLEPYLLHIV